MHRKPAGLAVQTDRPQSNLYQAIGGMSTCHQIATAFYSHVKQDPLLRPFFPGKTLKCAIEAFTAFLIEFLGGPSEDSQRRWWLSLRESHLRFKIGPQERAAWLKTMAAALQDVSFTEPVRAALSGFFERSSAYLVSRGQRTAAAEGSDPASDSMQQEFARRWDAQCRLDEIVAAVRRGDADCAIALAESSATQAHDFADGARLLALMLGSGHGTLLEYVREKLTRNPALAHQRTYGGRSLLHEASAKANLSMVQLLLRLGAAPNTQGGHGPLYALANECTVSGGGEVVRALVQAGASVNANDNVKQCTPLHMAARRGNVEIAEALLHCGADLEARDSQGDTPLRRSANCNKLKVAALLLSHGADRNSRGNKGLTPLQAARNSAMKQLLQLP